LKDLGLFVIGMFLEDLRVEQYYKNIIDLENLDDVFKKTPKELEKYF